MEVVYFELNDWFSGRDYPDAEPFLNWMKCNKENKYYIQFRDESWIEKNRLVVVESLVDMSMNFCITATRDWVEQNCPELLSIYKKFIRQPDEYDEPPYGRFGCPFLEYEEKNIGYHYADEVECNGYWQYVIDYEEE
jgi:hypothetical protein